MRLSRTAAVAGAALMLGGLGATAYAAGTTTLASSTAATSNITVTWSGQVRPANTNNAIFITQCWQSDALSTFNYATDCSIATGINPTFSASGSTTFEVFNGDESVLGEWGCGPLATVATSAQCYVRLAPGTATNTTGDEFLPLNYAPPTEIPEVPLNILLPAGAAAILGAAMFINRKRQSANA
jgi:hypothetical protein